MGKNNDVSSVVLDNDGVIRVTVTGDVDQALGSKLIEEVQQLTDELHAHGKKVLLYADLTRTGTIDTDAKRLSKEFFKTAKYDRIALVGASKENSQDIGFLINTIASVLRIKFFKNEGPALRWLRRERITLKTKAKWVLAIAASLSVLAVAWHQYIAPYLLRLPSDFSYQASVISHDNFYDEQAAGFSGDAVSDTKFSYDVTASRAGVLDIKNVFDVRTPGGEKIFSVARDYGIDRSSGRHVPGRGDRDRSGYLFAPKNLAKQDFTYWHVNYDEPATMKFQDEEDILGLTTYNYVADYHADQTNDLKHLPGVGTTRGVNLDINLRLWIEPQTGYLVKYEDHTTAYYYDLATGQRLNPWNQFSNSYSFDSIAAQVQKAERAKQRKLFMETIVPILFGFAAVILLIGCVTLLWRARVKRVMPDSILPQASALVVAAAGLIVELGWIIDSPALTRLHPSFSAMHVLTAANFVIAALVLWLLIRPNGGSRMKVIARLLLCVVIASAALSFAHNLFGFDIGIDHVLQRFDLPPIANISPITAICFLLVSGVLWALKSTSRIASVLSQAVLSLILMLVTVTIAGYAFSLEYLYSLGWFRAMALHTALLFVVLITGIFAWHQQWYITKLVRSVSKSLLLALAILALLLTLTGMSWQQSISSTTKQADIQFQGDANNLHTKISNELAGYVKALQGARGLFAASQEVDRSEWKAYVDGLQLPQNYPGMLGMGFVQDVSSAQKAAHIAKVRGEGFPAYTIHPESTSARYKPVVYIEPFSERNQRALGYDMTSDATRRAAMERARDTGEPALSGRVTLVQETAVDRQAGLLLFLPVYQHGAVTATVEQRRAALLGYVYTPIRMTDFMRATLGEQTHGLNIGVFDTATPEHLTLADRMYVVNSQYGIENQAYTPKFVRIEELPIAGHSLTLRYSSLPNYDVGAVQTLPAVVLFGGMSLSVLLAALTFLLSSSRNRALKLAGAMTMDLRAERNLAITNQHKDEAILTSIGDGVFVVDPSGKVVLFNQAAEQISGFSAQEAIGKPYNKTLVFYSSKDGQPADSFVATALSGKRANMAASTMLRRKDGTSLPVADSAAPIVNAKGTLEGAVVVFRDTTREKQLENMKDEFLSIASHELRTPMGAVRANLAMILEGDYGPVNKQLVEPLTDMKASTIRLVELVNDLLNVARIEAGRTQFTLTNFDINETLRSVVSSLAPLGKEKGVQISLAPKATTATVHADAEKIKQVLTNLIGNSLKFTDKGRITVAASLQKDTVEVAVSDTGIGITVEDQKKLFSKFNQVTSAQNGKPAGTGLGLYISREIVRKMGGDMWIKDSVPGKGSTFAFTIPLWNSPNAKIKEALKQEPQAHSDQK